MLTILNLLLGLWDPYNLYLFPKDEYAIYANEIQKFIIEHKDLDVDSLTNFVFQILPPINSSGSENLNKVEYEEDNDNMEGFE